MLLCVYTIASEARYVITLLKPCCGRSMSESHGSLRREADGASSISAIGMSWQRDANTLIPTMACPAIV